MRNVRFKITVGYLLWRLITSTQHERSRDFLCDNYAEFFEVNQFKRDYVTLLCK